MSRQQSDRTSRRVRERYTQIVLTVIAGLLTVIAVELTFVAEATTLPRATAQIPDTGLQRKQIVDEQRITNQRLSAILNHLKEGTINVRVEDEDARTKRSTTTKTSPRAKRRG